MAFDKGKIIGNAIKIGVVGGVGAMGAGVGGIGGAILGGQTVGSNNIEGAQIGTALGAAAGASTALLAMHPGALAGGALGVGSAAMTAVGSVGMGAAGMIGVAAMTVAPPVAAGVGLMGTFAAAKYASIAEGFAGKLVREIPKDAKTLLGKPRGQGNMLGHEITGFGKTLLAGSALVDGTVAAFDQFNRNRMGQVDPNMRRATPLLNNAGATGDLVFAMNKNRRG